MLTMEEIIDPRDLLVEIAGIFRKLNICYVITGGMAIFVWGRPRFTNDIDVVVNLDMKDIDRLAAILRKLHKAGYISEEMMQRAILHSGEFNFIDGRSGLKVDFWISGSSPYDKEQMRRGVWRTIKKQKVRFISPEDLVLSKLRWYKENESFKQKEDIESIFDVQKKLDWKYLRRWAKKQSTLKMLNSLK